jgi:hypothetical protein
VGSSPDDLFERSWFLGVREEVVPGVPASGIT